MFELDNITDIRVNHNHRLAVRDRNGREYIPPTGIEDMLLSAEENDIFQYRTKRVDSTVVRLENSMDSEFTPNQSQLSIEDITYNNDDGELYVLVTGHIQIPPAIILKNVGGITPAISQVSQVEGSSYIDGNTRLVVFADYTLSGTWNGAGECYGYENSFTITTEKPHGLTGTTNLKLNNPPAYIGALVIGGVIQVIVMSNTTLQWITSVFPTTPLITTSVNISLRNLVQVSVLPNILQSISAGNTLTGELNTVLAGTHQVSYKDTEYFYVYFEKYQTGTFPQQVSITILSMLAYLPYVITGETVEVRYKNNKTKRFKSINQSLLEQNIQKISVYGRDELYSEHVILNENIDFYFEQGAVLSGNLSTILPNINIVIDGNGTFKNRIISNNANMTGKISIKGESFFSIHVYSSENVYIDVNEIISNSNHPFEYNGGRDTYAGKALYLNFNQIIATNNTAMVISGNAHIKGGYIETSSIGHCLAIQGQDSRCYADIKHMKSIMNHVSGLGVNAEVVTLEDVGDTCNYGQELYLDFDLIELDNVLGAYQCSAVKTILGKIYLKNGKIISNSTYPAVHYNSFSGGRMRNVIIENSAGPALAIDNYYGVGYETSVEVINTQLIANSDQYAMRVGAQSGISDSYSHGKLVTSEVRNKSTNPASCGIMLGNNIVSFGLDSTMIVTGHASAKSVAKNVKIVTASTYNIAPVLNSVAHGIAAGQVIKLTGFDGDMVDENDNTYTVTAVTTDTLTLGSADFSSYSAPMTTGQIATLKNLPIKRTSLVKVAPESVFTTVTENTDGVNVIASLT